MIYITEIWNAIKYFIAPLASYFKGRYDIDIKLKNAALKKENEALRRAIDKSKGVNLRYDRIRDAVRLSKKERGDKPN